MSNNVKATMREPLHHSHSITATATKFMSRTSMLGAKPNHSVKATVLELQGQSRSARAVMSEPQCQSRSARATVPEL